MAISYLKERTKFILNYKSVGSLGILIQILSKVVVGGNSEMTCTFFFLCIYRQWHIHSSKDMLYKYVV